LLHEQSVHNNGWEKKVPNIVFITHNATALQGRMCGVRNVIPTNMPRNGMAAHRKGTNLICSHVDSPNFIIKRIEQASNPARARRNVNHSGAARVLFGLHRGITPQFVVLRGMASTAEGRATFFHE
jgi:aspartyl aminopeptidase